MSEQVKKRLYQKTTGLLLFAHTVAFIGFLMYGDAPQYVFKPPRDFMLGVLPYRQVIGIIAVVAMLAGLYLSLRNKLINPWRLTIQAGVFSVFLYAGFIMVAYHWFATDYEPDFVGIQEAESYLDSKDKINVVIVKGEVRGYPEKHILQPHFASTEIGGEEVAMTYCGLSNLGVAYSPVHNGEKLDLRTVGQLENNLIFYNTKTGEYYQQVTGGNDKQTNQFDKQYPTRAMSWESFKQLYPNALVYSNPPENLLDYMVRVLVHRALSDQEQSFDAHFPTIDHEDDPRLHPKQFVNGLRIGNQYVAYTKQFLREQNNIYNTEVNGTPIAVVYYPELDFVDMYNRRLGGETVVVTEIDEHGVLPQGGQLAHVPFFPELYWMIWHSYYPETAVKKSALESQDNRILERGNGYTSHI